MAWKPPRGGSALEIWSVIRYRRCGGERSNKVGRYYASGPSSVVSSTGYGVGVRIGHSGQCQSWLATGVPDGRPRVAL
jgi:hypothetical protein